MLEKIEATFEDVHAQCQHLEQDYLLPSYHSQIKDIQFRMQRVSRLVQVGTFTFETSSLILLSLSFVGNVGLFESNPRPERRTQRSS